MSVKQLNGCNKLLHSLRDDIEQRSTYRVRECLTLLGITPMLTSKQIKCILELSQDNDLAFLWFIWEAFYKTPHDCDAETDQYSINEQLILSAIAHLDMTTTMRALDQILPTAERSKKYQEMKRAERLKREEKIRKLHEERRPNLPFIIDNSLPYRQRYQQLKEARKLGKNRENVHKKGDKILPYLMPQLRPKLFEPMSMTSTPSDRKVVFPNYERYKDKHYRIPNESTRWFTTFELSPVKREIKKCLSDALAPLFGDNRKPLEKSVCNVHRMLELSAAKKEQQLTLETMERCMRLLHGQKEERRRRQIIRQLEEDVECAAEKLRRDAQRQLTKVQQLIGGTCNVHTGCQMCGKLATSPGFKDQSERKADLSFLLNVDFTLSHPIPEDAEEDSPVKVYQLGEQRLMKFITPEEVNLKNTVGANAHCSGNAKKQKSPHRCPPTEGVIKVLNDRGEVVKKVMPHEIPFCPPARQSSDASVDKFCSRKTMKSGVLQWDYFKIYKAPSQTQSEGRFRDTRPIVRSYCITALNQAIRRSSGGGAGDQKEQREQTERIIRNIKSDSALEAADKSAKQIFRESVKSKSLIGELRKSTMPRKDVICDLVSAEGFKCIESIDPDDTAMLIKLLKVAVDIMRRDPQYVLVTLPNAHMMPILVNWVAERYGKTYNYHQMRNMAKSARHVYDRLNRLDTIIQHVPSPKKKYIHNFSCMESYDKYHEYVCKIGQTQDEYHRRLNKMALDESRIIWLAMHGYSNLGGSITDTYFAYLPAKELDFIRHDLWNSRDFRDMTSIRRKVREKASWK
ncbi:uncharacterized protein LOC117782034 [Drosophila innubila]|uniref:uncharacterized protein LOC117782034 n=1 Tax=Drosophila innubila TaxID=198719 RepID=UPI00148BBF87|nr:uncharacterized protein LOC117782034 [Drosophila innubila]